MKIVEFHGNSSNREEELHEGDKRILTEISRNIKSTRAQSAHHNNIGSALNE